MGFGLQFDNPTLQPAQNDVGRLNRSCDLSAERGGNVAQIADAVVGGVRPVLPNRNADRARRQPEDGKDADAKSAKGPRSRQLSFSGTAETSDGPAQGPSDIRSKTITFAAKTGLNMRMFWRSDGAAFASARRFRMVQQETQTSTDRLPHHVVPHRLAAGSIGWTFKRRGDAGSGTPCQIVRTEASFPLSAGRALFCASRTPFPSL